MRNRGRLRKPREDGKRGGGRGIYIYGKNPIIEALLKKPQAVKRLLLSGGTDRELENIIARSGVKSETVKPKEIERVAGKNSVHQGVAALVDLSSLIMDVDDFLKSLKMDENTLLVLLDGLTDPHNVGAVIRSAAAFGASGVLLPLRNQAPVTGTVIKSSAGMAFAIPIVSIGNVNQTVDALKKLGFRTYALSMDGDTLLKGEPFYEPSLMVIGGENKGGRQKTEERCDVALKIPMSPECESLNVSVAAAIVLYEWSVKRHKA